MEIVYSDTLSPVMGDSLIIGIYGDIKNLLPNSSIYGIEYDDEWSVRRFLNGFRLFFNKKIYEVFDFLEIDKKILNTKLKLLSHTDLKFVLLAYLLVNEQNILIFDYFDYGLSYHDKKKFIKIIRKLKHDDYKITIISKDLFFLNKIVDIIRVFNDDELLFSGKIKELLSTDVIDCGEIVNFIKKANDKGASLEYTLEPNELLKDIYRSVV